MVQIISKLKSLVGILLGITLVMAAPALAGQARYIYDELGRLIRVVNEQGEVAVYNYDAVGNLLSIQRASSTDFPPSINSLPPTALTGAPRPV